MKQGDKISLKPVDYNAYYIENNQTLVIEETNAINKCILHIPKTLEQFALMNLSDEHLDSISKQLHEEKTRRLKLGI